MTNNIVPASAGLTAPRHTFLSSKEVIARFGWGRTYGYQMLNSSGFPTAIGGRYRLDTLMAWEDRVLAGDLSGRPDPQIGGAEADVQLESGATASADQPTSPENAGPHRQEAPYGVRQGLADEGLRADARRTLRPGRVHEPGDREAHQPGARRR